jgi:arylsulfatase A-like enzyme
MKYILLFSLSLAGSSLSQAQRPNIIYIMTDDMGYGDLSGYGRKDYSTPNIDRLASEGMRFTNAYAAGPLCTPTRTGFMTGRYPARTTIGLLEPLTQSKRDSGIGLTAADPSVATAMRSAGYETILVGKWHLGFQPEHSPTRNGFDYFFGIHSGGADYISHKSRAGGRAHDLFENDSAVYPEGYLTDLFTGKAIEFLRKKHDKPFFLVLTYNAPHWPWQGPADPPYPDSVDFMAGGSPATYAAMMKSLDDGVGKLVSILDEENLSSNTIIVFTNDNGGERYSQHGGLSKGKASLWEGGIRVPAFVRWPGKIREGITSQQVIITMDWTATFLTAAGAKDNPSFPLDGIDLLPVLTGKEKNIARNFYWRTTQRAKQQAMRSGKWKYLQDEKGVYLFDLDKDPAEQHDLKTKFPNIFEYMKLKYSEWEKTTLLPIPLEK